MVARNKRTRTETLQSAQPAEPVTQPVDTFSQTEAIDRSEVQDMSRLQKTLDRFYQDRSSRIESRQRRQSQDLEFNQRQAQESQKFRQSRQQSNLEFQQQQEQRNQEQSESLLQFRRETQQEKDLQALKMKELANERNLTFKQINQQQDLDQFRRQVDEDAKDARQQALQDIQSMSTEEAAQAVRSGKIHDWENPHRVKAFQEQFSRRLGMQKRQELLQKFETEYDPTEDDLQSFIQRNTEDTVEEFGDVPGFHTEFGGLMEQTQAQLYQQDIQQRQEAVENEKADAVFETIREQVDLASDSDASPEEISATIAEQEKYMRDNIGASNKQINDQRLMVAEQEARKGNVDSVQALLFQGRGDSAGPMAETRRYGVDSQRLLSTARENKRNLESREMQQKVSDWQMDAYKGQLDRDAVEAAQANGDIKGNLATTLLSRDDSARQQRNQKQQEREQDQFLEDIRGSLDSQKEVVGSHINDQIFNEGVSGHELDADDLLTDFIDGLGSQDGVVAQRTDDGGISVETPSGDSVELSLDEVKRSTFDQARETVSSTYEEAIDKAETQEERRRLEFEKEQAVLRQQLEANKAFGGNTRHPQLSARFGEQKQRISSFISGEEELSDELLTSFELYSYAQETASLDDLGVTDELTGEQEDLFSIAKDVQNKTTQNSTAALTTARSIMSQPDSVETSSSDVRSLVEEEFQNRQEGLFSSGLSDDSLNEQEAINRLADQAAIYAEINGGDMERGVQDVFEKNHIIQPNGNMLIVPKGDVNIDGVGADNYSKALEKTTQDILDKPLQEVRSGAPLPPGFEDEENIEKLSDFIGPEEITYRETRSNKFAMFWEGIQLSSGVTKRSIRDEAQRIMNQPEEETTDPSTLGGGMAGTVTGGIHGGGEIKDAREGFSIPTPDFVKERLLPAGSRAADYMMENPWKSLASGPTLITRVLPAAFPEQTQDLKRRFFTDEDDSGPDDERIQEVRDSLQTGNSGN